MQLVNNYHGVVGAAYTPSHNPNTRTNFAASYVTGSHAFKSGIDLAWAERGAWTGSVVPYSYVVSTLANNGRGGLPVPTTLTLRSDGCIDPLVRQVNGGLTVPTTTFNSSQLCPTFVNSKIDMEGGAFVQDRWTMDRVTLSLGLRLDWFNTSLPSVHYSPSILTPTRNFDVPAFQSVRQKDWTPKMAASWDVFGDGKTAMKMNFSKYVLGQSLVASNPLINLSSNNVTTTATRPWTDNDGDFVPDCDLTNAGAQGPTGAGSLQQIDTCGTVNPLFYQGLSTINVLDPATGQFVGAGDDQARYGWQKRPYSWEFSLSAQREIGKGVSVNGGYFRRWFGNFLVTDNLSVQASDYDPFSITPGLIPTPPASAGGQALPGDIITSGFYTPTAAASARAVNNFVGLSDTLFPGSNVIDHWNGFDLGINARLAARHHRPGRHQHRPADHRQLRHRRSGQRREVRQPVAADRIDYRDGGGRCPRRHRDDQFGEHLSRRPGLADAAEVPRLVHDPEGRPADRRFVPEHPWHRALGAVRRSQQRHRKVAAGRPAAGESDQSECDHEREHHRPAGRLLRPLESARPPPRQDSEVRADPGERQPRPLQSVQQGDHHRRELRVCDLAGPELGDRTPPDEGVVDVRLH